MPQTALSRRDDDQPGARDADRIGYDAWLLPPSPPSATDRVVRRCSTAAGPVVFVVALAVFVQQIV